MRLFLFFVSFHTLFPYVHRIRNETEERNFHIIFLRFFSYEIHFVFGTHTHILTSHSPPYFSILFPSFSPPLSTALFSSTRLISSQLLAAVSPEKKVVISEWLWGTVWCMPLSYHTFFKLFISRFPLSTVLGDSRQQNSLESSLQCDIVFAHRLKDISLPSPESKLRVSVVDMVVNFTLKFSTRSDQKATSNYHRTTKEDFHVWTCEKSKRRKVFDTNYSRSFLCSFSRLVQRVHKEKSWVNLTTFEILFGLHIWFISFRDRRQYIPRGEADHFFDGTW